ncbi:MAG TPA: hypothetical protein DFS52_12250, partial [Myxococcales bacterium]|nr:hypothetical protein [Myxococcales bacterium]
MPAAGIARAFAGLVDGRIAMRPYQPATDSLGSGRWPEVSTAGDPLALRVLLDEPAHARHSG